MRRFVVLAFALAVFGVVGPSAAEAQPDKVTICHATGSGRYVTLVLPWKAVFGKAGHFNENGTPLAGHEDDYLGPCVPTPTTAPPTTQPPTTQPPTTQRPTTVATTTPRRPTTTVTIVIDECDELLGGCPRSTPETTTTTVPDQTTTLPPADECVVVNEGDCDLPFTGRNSNTALIASLILAAGAALVGIARRGRTA